MGRFESCDEHLCMEAAFDLGGISTFEKEFDGFFEISRGGFDSLALTGYVKFWTERNIT